MSCHNFVMETANNSKNVNGRNNIRTIMANDFFLLQLSWFISRFGSNKC